jgi:outer membrane protein OmpA-like peptidoglycan-associated protein
MHTLENARSAVPFRRTLLTALPLVGCLVLASTAAAQPAPPFGPAPPGSATPPNPFGPPPGGPGAAPGGPGAPAPGGFGQPNSGGFGPAPGGPGGPGGPAPGTGDFSASFGGDVNTAGAPPAGGAPSGGLSEDDERSLSLMEQPNMLGSTGLLRTSYAGSGAAGTFRTSFMLDWFSTSNFLCNPSKTTLAGQKITCGANDASDKASHVGAFFALNATPLSFLEAYAMIRTYANSNDQGRPTLLQVLGDTTFGAKAFTPPHVGQIFTFGGELQMLLLNGTGGVGVAGGGTSALIRGLASADFRKPTTGGFPLRANLNLGYKIDNSGALVTEVEQKRGVAAGYVNDPTIDPETPARQPISRIERFGLGINRVDFFQTYLGVELPFSKIQPFIEWTVDVPVNRQGYRCHTSRVSQGDVCLGLDKFDDPNVKTRGGPGFKAIPSRFSLGLRANPFNGNFHGLSGMAAFDIGTSGTSTFIEEVAPTAPWTLYLGIGYAFDTKDKTPPPAPAPLPPPPPQLIPAPQTFARGLVHEQGKQDAVADAIVVVEGIPQPPYATGPDGRFLTRHLEPGTYKFNIKAPGFKPGSCLVNVGAPGAAPAGPPNMPPPGGVPSPFGGPPAGGPGGNPFGGPPAGGGFPGGPGGPGAPGGPGMMPPAPAPVMPQGPSFVDVDCPLEALPKLGNIVGQVKDSEGGGGVAGAVVKLSDGSGKGGLSATADGGGNFTFKDLQPGPVTLKTEASGFMSHTDSVDVRASDDNRTTVSITKRPKTANVKVEGKEIKISKQIHFETDSAKILGDSNSLLEEIADVMQHSPGIRKIEIQGHTDNTGTREHNLQLSDARANSVKAWLVAAGVDGTRLAPKGYGQDRPLAPNVTAANRQKNRRVQFIITEGK